MSPDYRSPDGALFRLDPDLGFHRLDEGMVISNGIGWSPDETIMYFCDSGHGVYAYDYDIETGAIANRRTFASFDEDQGSPDGSAVDAEGHLWVAMAGGGQILRLAPDGSVDRRIAMNARFPASVAFGGSDLATLFVTTMSPFDGSPGGPDDGIVFAFEPGVAGMPMHRFGG
jgi:sugar lactone lactonase YvrE